MQSKNYINGADYFQLYLDRENKKSGIEANTVRLLLVFEEKVDLNQLKSKLEKSGILSEINGLQLKSSSFNNYFYWNNAVRKQVSIKIKSWTEEPGKLQPFAQLPEGEWLNIELLNGENTDAVLFHMHHLIADNKGFQQLIQTLNENPNASIQSNPSMNKCKTAFTFFKHTWGMLKPKKGHMLTFSDRKKSNDKVGMKFHLLSKHENEITALKRVKEGMVFPGASTVILNQIISALEKCNYAGHKNDFYWVPMPVDRRKKGGGAFSLGNQLSFLFYKIDSGQSDTSRLKSMQDQLIDQAKNKSVVKYEQLTNTMTKFPYPLYKAMLELPDRGKFCSFTYSDLGQNFSNIEQFMGHKLSNVLNFPSIPLVPGIVFVTMQYRDKFHLVLGVMESVVSDDDAKCILNEISSRL